MRCCAGDGGAGAVGLVALRDRRAGGVANHPELLRSRAVVVSVVGKVAPRSAAGVDHEGERKRTTDDVSKTPSGIKTGDGLWPRDESGGRLLTAQMVPGMEVARAWSGLLCGTWEPVAPRPRAASGAVLAHGCSRAWACAASERSSRKSPSGSYGSLRQRTIAPTATERR
jgi:hypothetical protein